MGEHAAHDRARVGHQREEQDELAAASHQRLAAAYERGFFDDLVTPYLGLERDQNLRPDSTPEKLAKLKPVFGDGDDGDDDRGQLDAAVRRRVRRAAGQRRVGGASTTCRCSRTCRTSETAAVDYVHGDDGLLMAPAYAVPRLLDAQRADAAGLRLLRDPRGVRLAGARHAEGLGGPGVLPRAAGPRRAARARSTAPSST